MEAAILPPGIHREAVIPTTEAIPEAAITEIPMYSEHRAVQAAPSPIFWDQCSDKFFLCPLRQITVQKPSDVTEPQILKLLQNKVTEWTKAQPLAGRFFCPAAMEFVPG